MALGEPAGVPWRGVVELAASRGDRLVVEHEMALRVVLRSEGDVGEVLERAARLIDGVTRDLRGQLVWARRIFFAHRGEATGEEALRIASRIGALQLHLLGLLIAHASVACWRRQLGAGEDPGQVREKARVGLGIVPLEVDVESWMDDLFAQVRRPDVEA